MACMVSRFQEMSCYGSWREKWLGSISIHLSHCRDTKISFFNKTSEKIPHLNFHSKSHKRRIGGYLRKMLSNKNHLHNKAHIYSCKKLPISGFMIFERERFSSCCSLYRYSVKCKVESIYYGIWRESFFSCSRLWPNHNNITNSGRRGLVVMFASDLALDAWPKARYLTSPTEYYISFKVEL
jgi:hypothetical protein